MKTKTTPILGVLLATALNAAAQDRIAPVAEVMPVPAIPATPLAPPPPAPQGAPDFADDSSLQIVVPTIRAEQIAEPVRMKLLYQDHFDGLKRGGPVTYMGVSSSPPPRELAPHLPIPEDTGLVIDFVAKDSPADKAGLKQSDVLAKLDDQIIIHPRQLSVLVANHKEGDSVKITYVRKGQLQETNVTLVKQEAPEPGIFGKTSATPGDVFLSAEPGKPLKTIIRRLQDDSVNTASAAADDLAKIKELHYTLRQAAEPKVDDEKQELEKIRALLEALNKRLDEKK